MLHMRSKCCDAMENDMSELSLRSVHPVEKKEITPLGVRLVTRMVIGSIFVTLATPFVIHVMGQ